MKVAGIKVATTEEATRVKWILGVHAGAAACGGISLAWLVILILFTSHEGKCGGYEVEHDENLGKWHTSGPDSFSVGFVCERPAELGCLSAWIEFQGSCYIRVCQPVVFKEAQKGCSERGAKLVSISSDAENEHVLELCGRQSCWLGLARSSGAKAWQWQDGTPAGWFGNWTSYNRFDAGVAQNMKHVVMNKGPPKRFIEEPVFVIKAVGKFLVPACLLFIAYLALKRSSTDLAQCLCIVDGFFAACLFAEMVIMVFRLMKGGPLTDIFAYLLFMVFASCGMVFCCACSTKALRSLQAQFLSKEGKEMLFESQSIMHGGEPADAEALLVHPAKISAPPPHIAAPTASSQHASVSPQTVSVPPQTSSVSPQALGHVDMAIEIEPGSPDSKLNALANMEMEIEADHPPEMPRLSHDLSCGAGLQEL